MFPSNLMAPQVGQRGNKLSPRLWARLIEDGLTADGSAPGDLLVEDFVSPCVAKSASGEFGNLYFYDETAATVGPSTEKSVIELSSGATANKSGNLVTGGNVGNLGAISDAAGADKLTIFEARIKLEDVADGSVFVGLSKVGTADASKPFAGTTNHTLQSEGLIGFVINKSAPSALTFVYKADGVTEVTLLTASASLVGGQFYNLGFVYDPSAPASEKIKVYIDNVEQAQKVTADNIAASSFPDGTALAASIAARASSGAKKVFIDLLAYYQAG